MSCWLSAAAGGSSLGVHVLIDLATKPSSLASGLVLAITPCQRGRKSETVRANA
jgi:hypothetical protein